MNRWTPRQLNMALEYLRWQHDPKKKSDQPKDAAEATMWAKARWAPVLSKAAKPSLNPG